MRPACLNPVSPLRSPRGFLRKRVKTKIYDPLQKRSWWGLEVPARELACIRNKKKMAPHYLSPGQLCFRVWGVCWPEPRLCC